MPDIAVRTPMASISRSVQPAELV